MSDSLYKLRDFGQSVWYDNLCRDMLQDGTLATLIDRQAVTGVTTNPAIFLKAITGSDLYDDQIQELCDRDGEQILTALTVQDVRDACDLFRPVYEETNGQDGFVSIEVSPHLAFNVEGTITEALHLREAVDRANVMIKIPGTSFGVSALEECIGRGINVNSTLLFSVDRYYEVARAYFRGLQRAFDNGHDLSRIASVASFFVSRVDTLVDNKLKSVSSLEADGVRGQIGVANAKLAYQKFSRLFTGKKWKDLAQAGGRVQRPLWASVSMKNAAYRDVFYVESLIGIDTVTTLPPATLEAFAEHGVPLPRIEDDIFGARHKIQLLQKWNMHIDGITARLEREGVQAFADAYDACRQVLEKKSRSFGR